MEQIAPLPPTQGTDPRASLGPQVTPASLAKRHMGGVAAYPRHAGICDEERVQKHQELGSQRHMQLGTSVRLASPEPFLCRAIRRSILARAAVKCGHMGEEDHRPKSSANIGAAGAHGCDSPAIQSEISGPPETNVGKGGERARGANIKRGRGAMARSGAKGP